VLAPVLSPIRPLRLGLTVWLGLPAWTEGRYRRTASIEEVKFDGVTDGRLVGAESVNGPGHSQVFLFFEFNHDHGMATVVVVDTFSRRPRMKVHEQVDRAAAAHWCRNNVERPTVRTHRPRGLVIADAVGAAIDQQLTVESAPVMGCVVAVHAMAREQFEKFRVAQVTARGFLFGLVGIGHRVTLCADER